MNALFSAIHRLATVLFRLRALLWLIGAVGAVAFVSSAIVGSAPDSAGLAGLIGVVWSGYLLAVAHFFSGGDVGRYPTGLRARIRRALGATLVRAAAIVLLALGGIVLAFTFKAISAAN